VVVADCLQFLVPLKGQIFHVVFTVDEIFDLGHYSGEKQVQTR
jgi:hypothetical protein